MSNFTLTVHRKDPLKYAGGGGTFKVMVSVFDGNCDPEITFKMNEVPGQLNTGVNRLLPLALVKKLITVAVSEEGLSPHRISIVEAIFMVFVVSLSLVTTIDRNYFSLLICAAAELRKRRVLHLCLVLRKSLLHTA